MGNAYKVLLRDAQARRSHSHRRDCDNNAQAEELEARGWPVFADLADAQASVADYFDYCNYERRYSSIGHLKPYNSPQQQLNNST